MIPKTEFVFRENSPLLVHSESENNNIEIGNNSGGLVTTYENSFFAEVLDGRGLGHSNLPVVCCETGNNMEDYSMSPPGGPSNFSSNNTIDAFH